ncbi:MAG: AsmA-like C-terminal domain-containing protein [Campylobacterales bacterium]
MSHRILSLAIAWMIAIAFIIALFLFQGIYLQRFEQDGVTLEGLYIKFDKNLIVNAQYVEIQPNIEGKSDPLERLSDLMDLVDILKIAHLKAGTLRASGIVLTKQDRLVINIDQINYITNSYQQAQWPPHQTTLYQQLSSHIEQIKIKQLSFKGGDLSVEADNLLALFDNQLSLVIETLSLLPKKRHPFAPEEFYSPLARLHPLVSTIVARIHIPTLTLDNKRYTFDLNKREYRLQGSSFVASGYFESTPDKIRFHLEKARFYRPNLQLSGTISFWRRGIADARLSWHGFDANGSAMIVVTKEKATINLTTLPFTTLAPLADELDVGEEAKAWLTRYATARSYRLKTLLASFSKPDWKLIDSSVIGEGKASLATIRFEESLPPLLANELSVSFRNNTLYFEGSDLSYDGIPLEHASATITNAIFPSIQESRLNLDIKATAPFDKRIRRLLAHYGGDLELNQDEGASSVAFTLDLGLESNDSTVHADVTTEGNYTFYGHKISSKGGSLHIDNDRVIFDQFNIVHGANFEGNLTGELNTTSETMKGVVKLSHLILGERGNYLDIHQTAVPIFLTYHDGIKGSLPTLDANIAKDENKTTITLEDLSKLVGSSRFLQEYNITQGRAKIELLASGRSTIEAWLREWPTPLLKEGEPMTDWHLKIDTNDTTTTITTIPNDLSITLLPNAIKIELSGIDLNLSALQQLNPTTPTKPLTIEGHSSTLYVANFALPFEHYLIESVNAKRNFNMKTATGEIRGVIEDGNITIDASDIRSDFFSKTSGLKGLKEGNFSLSLAGQLDDCNATITIEKGRLADVGVFNSVIALINTIPSIVIGTSDNLGFAGDDYKFENATIHLTYQHGLLIFNTIDVNGYHTDVSGSGYIDLSTKEIHIHCVVNPVKALRKIIGHVPIVRHILLGKGEGLTTEFDITGTLEAPKIETFVIHGLLLAPINLIWRTLQMPFRVFESNESQ